MSVCLLVRLIFYDLRALLKRRLSGLRVCATVLWFGLIAFQAAEFNPSLCVFGTLFLALRR